MAFCATLDTQSAVLSFVISIVLCCFVPLACLPLEASLCRLGHLFCPDVLIGCVWSFSLQCSSLTDWDLHLDRSQDSFFSCGDVMFWPLVYGPQSPLGCSLFRAFLCVCTLFVMPSLNGNFCSIISSFEFDTTLQVFSFAAYVVVELLGDRILVLLFCSLMAFSPWVADYWIGSP